MAEITLDPQSETYTDQARGLQAALDATPNGVPVILHVGDQRPDPVIVRAIRRHRMRLGRFTLAGAPHLHAAWEHALTRPLDPKTGV